MLDQDKVAKCAREFAKQFRINPVEPTSSNIAKAIKCSRNSVRPYLEEACRKNFLQLVLRLPVNDELERELPKHYSCLKEAVVVGQSKDIQWADQEWIRPLLAGEVASYLKRFANRVRGANASMTELRIGVDGGYTLYLAFHDTGMLDVPRIKYEILPLVLGPLVGTPYTATNVATLLASRLNVSVNDIEVLEGFGVTPVFQKNRRTKQDGPSRSMRLLLSIERSGHQRVGELDILICAIGSKEAGLLKREMELLKLPQKDIKRHYGDICNLGFEENGTEVPMNVGRANLVTLDTLRKASTNKDQTVVGVGGGREKLGAIRTALLHSFMSVLITDARTAEELMQTG